MTKVTFGADPEFFVKERATGTIIPACGLFGGSKGSPVILNSSGGYLEDGVTIEINCIPAATIAELTTRILALKALWEQRFPQHELVVQSSAEFPRRELRKHRQAMQIGCNADLCAWGIRRIPQISDFGNMRFAGGHIHVGLYPWPENLEKELLIKWLDVFALLPCIDVSSRYRFEHYGRPGLYRETDYGVEWRSPDPAWVIGNSNVATLAESSVTALLASLTGFKEPNTTRNLFNSVCARRNVEAYFGMQHLDINEIPNQLKRDARTWLERFVP